MKDSINDDEGIEVTGVKDGDRGQSVHDDDDEDDEHENPFNELGFGFTAYFGMLRTFICMFLLFSIIMAPAIVIYGT